MLSMKWAVLMVVDAALMGAWAVTSQDPLTTAAPAIAIIAQLLTPGIILGIGVWAVKSFLTFKESVIVQAAKDRAELKDSIQSLKEDMEERHDAGHQSITDSINLLRRENDTRHDDNQKNMLRMQYLLFGVEGSGGGLVADVQASRDRRHALANQMAVISLKLIEMMEVQAAICGKLGIPYDQTMIRSYETQLESFNPAPPRGGVQP